MAIKPLTTEAIALTQKKVDMSLDDIIKMSKKKTFKGKSPPGVSNKNRGFQKVVAPQRNSSKVQRFMDARSSVRQGVLAQRRTNFRAQQFPLTTELARKAVFAPIRHRVINWNNPRVTAPSVQRPAVEGSSKEGAVKPRLKTLDALFANMKQQRMRAMNLQLARGGGGGMNSQRYRGQLQQQWQVRGGGSRVGMGRPVGVGQRMGRNFK